ncbi:E3 ubiquitin-protein ligase makorin-1 [Tyrophagus putrescentiae]|nr:E3 ubiquitin-protein ligase makorin-1 [Tyrophagus putrescentiae]
MSNHFRNTRARSAWLYSGGGGGDGGSQTNKLPTSNSTSSQPSNSTISSSHSKEDICCVCLEPVAANRRRYALLERCDHRYCEPCGRQLVNHRRHDEVSTGIRCPTCRQPSNRIIMSDVLLLARNPQKAALFDSVLCCAPHHGPEEDMQEDWSFSDEWDEDISLHGDSPERVAQDAARDEAAVANAVEDAESLSSVDEFDALNQDFSNSSANSSSDSHASILANAPDSSVFAISPISSISSDRGHRARDGSRNFVADLSFRSFDSNRAQADDDEEEEEEEEDDDHNDAISLVDISSSSSDESDMEMMRAGEETSSDDDDDDERFSDDFNDAHSDLGDMSTDGDWVDHNDEWLDREDQDFDAHDDFEDQDDDDDDFGRDFFMDSYRSMPSPILSSSDESWLTLLTD